MSKGYHLLINLVVIAIISYLAADMVNTFIGARLEPSYNHIPNNRERKTSEIRPLEKNYYSTIIERNIFNSRAKGSPDPEGIMHTDNIPKEIGDLKIKLQGTIIGDGITPYAIVEEQERKEQQLFRLNDAVVNDVRVVKIERNYIIVANNSAQKRLDIYDSTASYSENERPTMESEGRRGLTGNADSGKMMLDKREIAGVLENIPKLLTQARLVPNFSQGKADGFRVVSITPDSFYAKIGIKNGDVLQRINGMELREPDSFFKVFQQLKDESDITLDLIRNNKKETLDYEIQ
ncbi:MAG TPA: type II secretion system protein GspC [Nitrospiria bacterium]|nr:type II secretion system protein GspC [Nitrospiria bacterium]